MNQEFLDWYGNTGIIDCTPKKVAFEAWKASAKNIKKKLESYSFLEQYYGYDEDYIRDQEKQDLIDILLRELF